MSLRLLAVPAALIAAAAASTAWACSCIGYADAASQLAEAQVMVIARAEWTKPERGASDPRQSVTRFRVVRTIKGEPRRGLAVRAPYRWCDVRRRLPAG